MQPLSRPSHVKHHETQREAVENLSPRRDRIDILHPTRVLRPCDSAPRKRYFSLCRRWYGPYNRRGSKRWALLGPSALHKASRAMLASLTTLGIPFERVSTEIEAVQMEWGGCMSCAAQ